MKISGQINGVNIDLGERPEPVEDGGQWWEAVEYRKPLPGENVYDLEEIHLIKSCSNRCREWIMRPIPAPTPEQLKAIGMRERDDRPVECKSGDKIWDGTRCATYYSGFGHMHRWVLEDVPVEKEPAHTECAGCHYSKTLFPPIECSTCCPPGSDNNAARKNYTPAPVTGVGAMEQSLLDTISECCDKLGRSRHQTITEFIYALAEKARQSPTPAPTRGLTGEGE
jgi:hypothetical protein